MALQRFIVQLEKDELKPTISQDEIDDIEKGVNMFVKLLTDEVGKMEKIFTIKRILKVGSFYEKTKVGNPDEFDFLLELDGTFKIERGCEHNPCSAHVKSILPVFINKSVLSQEKQSPADNSSGQRTSAITAVFKETELAPEGYFPADMIYEHWRMKLRAVLSEALSTQNSLSKIQCEMGHFTIDQKLHGSRPNAEIGLKWHGEKEHSAMGISIDLSLCVPCTDELLEMWQSELIPLDFSEMPRPVLVVPSHSRTKLNACCLAYKMDDGKLRKAFACWKISTAPIEVAKMRNMPEPYRSCYLVLKWICKLRDTPNSSSYTDSMLTLSSYMMKNAVLYCQATDEQKDTVSCLMQVLHYLCARSEVGFLPAYLMPKVNLWKFVNRKVTPPHKVLDLLTNFLVTLKESSAENFRFSHAKAKIRALQREFTDIQLDALNFKPMLALENGPLE